MVYEYQCTAEDCGAITERVQRLNDPRPEEIDCKYCEDGVARFKISAPAVLTGSMTNQALDVAIGRDANARWQSINDRKNERDKVRVKTQQNGIVASNYDNYQPISNEQRELRTKVTRAVDRDGFKAEPLPTK
jgi:hypothetical protein